MPKLNEFDEAERRQISENELFNLEDDEEMAPTKSKSAARKNKQDAAKKRMTPTEREKARITAERDAKQAKLQATLNARKERATRRAGRMDGVEVGAQQPVEPAPQARDTTPPSNAADDARRVEAALQEQIALENPNRDERQASVAPRSEMDYDAELAAQFEAETAAANARAQEPRRSSPDIDELAIQEELGRQIQAETAASDAARAPSREDNLRLRELEAQNEALRKAVEMANQERLNAVSTAMAETTRADDATAANQQLTKQLSQAEFDRDSTEQLTQDLKARNAELLARQAELERQSETTIGMDKASIEAANRARQEADARASRLEAVNQVLRRERNEAVNSLGERDQQLAQARARNEALTKSQVEAKQTADSRIADLESRNLELVKKATQADVSVTLEKANREAAERELVKRIGELSATKASLTAERDAERDARKQADAAVTDLDGKLKAANDAAALEKAGREAAEKEVASQKKLVVELSGEGDKAKALETARRDAESKAKDLEGKLQSATELAASEKAGRKTAEAASKAVAEEAQREKAAREAAEKDVQELTTKNDKLETQANDLDGKLKAANDAAALEKASREAAEKEVASQKKLVVELSGEGGKAKALETVRRDAESKAKDLEGKLQSATELAASEKAGRETAEAASKAVTEEAQRERTAREAAEKNVQDLTTRNDQLETQAKEATLARVQTEERMKTMSDLEQPDGDSELRNQLEQEKAARQATEVKLAAATARMIEQSKAAAAARMNGTQQGTRDAERIARLEAELKAARETPNPDKAIPSIEKDVSGKDAGQAVTATKEDEFGLNDINEADFDAAVTAAEAEQKEVAAPKAKDDEFGMDDISTADFDAAVAAAEVKLKETATAAKAAEASRTTPAPASRAGSTGLDPAHTDKGKAWYRAGKIFVPEAEYDRMLKAGVKFNKEIEKGIIKRVPLEADKSAREVLLQAPNGDPLTPRAYRGAHGPAAFEARAKAEGLDPKMAAKWAARDPTRPQGLVERKNGNLVDIKSVAIAAGKEGVAGKYGEKNVYIENQMTSTIGGEKIETGTGNYRRLDNAIARARTASSAARLNQRLDSMRVTPQPEGRGLRNVTPASNLSTSRSASPPNRGTTPGRAASAPPDRRLIYRNGEVVASAPVNGNNGAVKRLNNKQRAASAPFRQENLGEARSYRGGTQPATQGDRRPDRGGAHNRQTSPTTTINLTVNGAVGHGTATPNAEANAVPRTKYTPELDLRTRIQDTLGRK